MKANKGVPLDGIKDPVVRAALMRVNRILADLDRRLAAQSRDSKTKGKG